MENEAIFSMKNASDGSSQDLTEKNLRRNRRDGRRKEKRLEKKRLKIKRELRFQEKIGASSPARGKSLLIKAKDLERVIKGGGGGGFGFLGLVVGSGGGGGGVGVGVVGVVGGGDDSLAAGKTDEAAPESSKNSFNKMAVRKAD